MSNDCTAQRRCEQCNCCRLAKNIAKMLTTDWYAALRFQALMSGENDPGLYRSFGLVNRHRGQ